MRGVCLAERCVWNIVQLGRRIREDGGKVLYWVSVKPVLLGSMYFRIHPVVQTMSTVRFKKLFTIWKQLTRREAHTSRTTPEYPCVDDSSTAYYDKARARPDSSYSPTPRLPGYSSLPLGLHRAMYSDK